MTDLQLHRQSVSGCREPSEHDIRMVIATRQRNLISSDVDYIHGNYSWRES